MSTELEILSELAQGNHLVVEKATNLCWSEEDLQGAGLRGDYLLPDFLHPNEELQAVSAPFPGCMQIGGATEEYLNYELIGQTRHFLIFRSPEHKQ